MAACLTVGVKAQPSSFLKTADAAVRKYCSFGSVRGSVAPAVIFVAASYALGDQKPTSTFGCLSRDLSGFKDLKLTTVDTTKVVQAAQEAIKAGPATFGSNQGDEFINVHDLFNLIPAEKQDELTKEKVKAYFQQTFCEKKTDSKFYLKQRVGLKEGDILLPGLDPVYGRSISGKGVALNVVRFGVLVTALVNAYRDFKAVKTDVPQDDESEEQAEIAE